MILPPFCLSSIGLSIKNSPLALNESVEFMIGTVHCVMTAAKCAVLMSSILANKRWIQNGSFKFFFDDHAEGLLIVSLSGVLETIFCQDQDEISVF